MLFDKDTKPTWAKIFEGMEEIEGAIGEITSSENITDTPIGPASAFIDADVEKELLATLNQVFTPILVMQGVEGDLSDKIQEAFSEASILTERNIIRFDDESRMAQLISVCALLLSRQKKTDKFQTWQDAIKVQKAMKLEIQKDEYAAAKALAQKFLVAVSTTNNSSVARTSAQDLLPQTQH